MILLTQKELKKEKYIHEVLAKILSDGYILHILLWMVKLVDGQQGRDALLAVFVSKKKGTMIEARRLPKVDLTCRTHVYYHGFINPIP